MKKLCVLSLMIMGLSIFLPAQDVVRLRDGSTVSGRVMEHIVDDHVRIRTETGEVQEYRMEEVERVSMDRRTRSFALPTKGYFNHSTFQVVIGNSFASSMGSSLYMVNGWQWNAHWMAGIGIGKEWIRFQRLVPFCADVRYNLFAAKASPYLNAFAGYSIPLGDTYSDTNAFDGWNRPFGRSYGGITAGLLLGYANYRARSLAYTLSFGVRYQGLSSYYPDVFFQGQQTRTGGMEHLNLVLAQVGVGFLIR